MTFFFCTLQQQSNEPVLQNMERLEIAKQTTNKKVKHAIAKDSESK